MATINDAHADARGSLWHRWDPHIHAPGTLFNDRYGKESWDEFLTRLEAATPQIEALGLTDYLVLDSYERVLEERATGRLPQVQLIFPNIEMRFAVTAGKGSPINFHLLVSPEDPDHVALARKLLLDLTFKFRGETYRCSTDDLTRLGKAYDSSITDSAAALKAGALQFKVDPDQLIGAFRASEWAQRNVLIAVAGSRTDGTSQLQADSSLSALRRKLEAESHIIFASQTSQRDFWLGRGAATSEYLLENYGGLKPCLHGSDAHDLETVGKPALDRFTWIKGDLTFESLRQACIEPASRAHIGTEPPKGGTPSNTIAALTVAGAPWFNPSDIPINPGLVAVIGARGSGKSALVELVAAAADATDGHLTERSFLMRAQEFVRGVATTVGWEDGKENAADLGSFESDGYSFPRVQFLSQQFVDQLCSSDGLAEELVGEIERVVFNSHPHEDRLGAENFQELLDFKAAEARSARARESDALRRTITSLVEQRVLKRSLAGLKRTKGEKEDALKRDLEDRKSLIGTASDERVARHNDVSAACDRAQSRVNALALRHQSLKALQAEVEEFRSRTASERLLSLKASHANAGLTDEQWEAFGLVFAGDVDETLRKAIAEVEIELKTARGPSAGESPAPTDYTTAQEFIAKEADLDAQTLSLLRKELSRLNALIGVDKENTRKHTLLTEKISKAEAELKKLTAQIDQAERADARIDELQAERTAAYKAIIQAIVDEERMLEELHAPLVDDLSGRGGTIQKLSFSVRRTVDLDAWASAGEELLDLRTGPFRGSGKLREAAEKVLLPAWLAGDAEAVSDAMIAFRRAHESDLLEHRPATLKGFEAREWAERMGTWLYSTDHIQLSYGIQYEGVDIQQLSPGTRGIVLLLLYLAIDRDDDRPLIIDQPEENLDPKSIFDELVTAFRDAKSRRQIIIVTHNANLVVNTDADQVIIARAGVHSPGKLPEMRYISGGLENPTIREDVCNILEGGAAAFVERAKRLRVGF